MKSDKKKAIKVMNEKDACEWNNNKSSKVPCNVEVCLKEGCDFYLLAYNVRSLKRKLKECNSKLKATIMKSGVNIKELLKLVTKGEPITGSVVTGDDRYSEEIKDLFMGKNILMREINFLKRTGR